MTGVFVGYNIKTGQGLSFISSTNTLENTGVLSLQGDTGSLSLASGTGISISGLTIANTGLISASAGSGISVSGTDPLTITNTGVLSLQGDTGALSLVAGSGIGISGLTFSNTGVLGVGGGTTNYLSGSIKLVAGSDIDITQSGQDITIANTYSYSLPNTVLTSSSTYVKTLQGDSGALSLVAGTGIGISGLTISNTGIVNLSAGSGISVSGNEITNTGVLGIGGGTTAYLSGDIKLVAGNSISISQGTTTITIDNTYSPPTNILTSSSTYVKTLDGSSGALTLGSGTGISISGLTITNTGIISASAGNGIGVSGSDPLTITNTGVLGVGGGTTSYLTGDVKFVAGSDISITQSGQDITIANTYSYTLPSTVLTSSSTYVKTLQGSSGTLNLTAGSGIGISGLTISNTGIINLASGSGISVSGNEITNTGVLGLGGGTTAYLGGNIELKAGSSIGISQGTTSITISNTYSPPSNILTSSSTYVKTLDGSSGALSLGSGSGISISGLTITNVGVLGVGGGTTSYLTGDIKFVAGSNIGISQSGQDITISNTYSLPSTVLTSSSTYVKTLQGSSGALTLSAGTGISISGLTITNTEPNIDYPAQANTWSALQTFGDNISFMGEQVSGSSISAGSFLYDNGTNFVRQSLAGGTGISISDYTITNAGVTSLTAGTGISLSGSTGDVTITNTGSSYTAGNGITLTNDIIAMSGDYTGNFTLSGNYLLNTSISTTSATTTYAFSFGINGNSVFSEGVYSPDGKSFSTTSQENMTWFLKGGVNNSTFLSVSGLGNASIAGNITSGKSIIVADNNNGSGYKLYLAGTDVNHYIYSSGSGGNNTYFGEYNGAFNWINTNSGDTNMTLYNGNLTLYGTMSVADLATFNNGIVLPYNSSYPAGASNLQIGATSDFNGNTQQFGIALPSGAANWPFQIFAGGGTSAYKQFYVSVQSEVGTKNNILDDGSGNLIVGGSLFIKSVSFVVLSAGNGGADITSGYAYIPVQGVCMLLVNGVYNEVDLGQWIFQNQPYAPNNGTGTQNAGSGELFCASGSSVDCIWEIIQIGVG